MCWIPDYSECMELILKKTQYNRCHVIRTWHIYETVRASTTYRYICKLLKIIIRWCHFKGVNEIISTPVVVDEWWCARAVHITTLVKLEVWNVSDCRQTIVNTDSLLIDKKDTGIQLLQMCDYIFFKWSERVTHTPIEKNTTYNKMVVRSVCVYTSQRCKYLLSNRLIFCFIF